MYSINSYWQCGSCPHLFFKSNNGFQQYSRELLVPYSGEFGDDCFTIPSLISHVIIRELEDEITYLEKITLNGVTILKDQVLNKGDSLEFKVNPNDEVKIIGKYVPLKISEAKANDLCVRNWLITNSNKIHNKKLKPSYNNASLPTAR